MGEPSGVNDGPTQVSLTGQESLFSQQDNVHRLLTYWGHKWQIEDADFVLSTLSI